MIAGYVSVAAAQSAQISLLRSSSPAGTAARQQSFLASRLVSASATTLPWLPSLVTDPALVCPVGAAAEESGLFPAQREAGASHATACPAAVAEGGGVTTLLPPASPEICTGAGFSVPALSSTPKQPWSEVVCRGPKRVLAVEKAPPPLALSNRFTILTEGASVQPEAPVTPAAAAPPAPPGIAASTAPAASVTAACPRSSAARSKSGFSMMLKQAVVSRSEGLPRVGSLAGRSRYSPSTPLISTSAPAAMPTCLVVGSSMVRHISIPRAETFCYSGAQVSHITTQLPDIVHTHPAASSIITHIGSNDLKLQQSETLKADFKTLIDTVLAMGKQCIISGPLPSPRFGDIKFSRVRQLHVWLKSYCRSLGIPFVDNFTAFWNRPNLFARDGLHPNRAGKRLLANNMLLTLESASTVALPVSNAVQQE